MPSILANLAANLDHARRVHRTHDRLVQLQDDYDRAPNAASRAVVADNIADRMDSQAERLEQSWLARAATFLPPPAAIRAEADAWRRRAEEAWASEARAARAVRRGPRVTVEPEGQP